MGEKSLLFEDNMTQADPVKKDEGAAKAVLSEHKTFIDQVTGRQTTTNHEKGAGGTWRTSGSLFAGVSRDA